MSSRDLQALRAFREPLPPEATVLAAASSASKALSDENRWLEAHGCAVDLVEKDLRLLSLKTEHYDGIWCPREIDLLPIEHTQRVLLTFLKALKPRTGVLAVSYRENPEGEGAYTAKAVGSLFRQCGFLAVLEGRVREGDQSWVTLVCRRV